MKVLITGGTGFIGEHFVPVLLSDGHEVVLLDLWSPSSALEKAGVRFVHGDIRDESIVKRAMQGCDAVLHLAAAHHDFGIEEDTYFSVNERGTEVLCNVMTRLGVERMCFFSSVAVYGDGTLPDESSIPRPTHSYGRSKLAAERVLEGWVREDEQRSVLVIRPSMTFGPGNFANMFKLIRQIDGRAFFPVGRGKNHKSMVFVTNLVDATLHAWSSLEPGMSVFNYVDKPDLTSRQIIEGIYQCLGRRRPTAHVPLGFALALAKPLDVLSQLVGRRFPITQLGIQKLAGLESTFEAAKILEAGFEPAVSLQNGISRMVDWYQSVPRGEDEARLPPSRVVTTSQ